MSSGDEKGRGLALLQNWIHDGPDGLIDDTLRIAVRSFISAVREMREAREAFDDVENEEQFAAAHKRIDAAIDAVDEWLERLK